MKIRLLQLLNWGVAALYVYLAWSGAFGYSIWGQIMEVAGSDPLRLLQQGHTHALRLMVVLPALFVAQNSPFSADAVFGLYVGLAIVVAGYLSARSACLAATGSLANVRYFSTPVLLGLIFIATQMNGRIAFAFFGFSLIIGAQVAYEMGRIRSVWWLLAQSLLGLFFMSVSTGAFLIGVFTIFRLAVVPYPVNWPYASKSRLLMFVVSIGLLAALYGLISDAVFKNIEYYGGGWGGALRMLKHGLGRFLPTDTPFLLLLAVTGVAIGLPVLDWLGRKLQRHDPRGPIYMGLFFAAFGGIFGISTLMVGIPLALSVFAMWLWTPYLRPVTLARPVAILD